MDYINQIFSLAWSNIEKIAAIISIPLILQFINYPCKFWFRKRKVKKAISCGQPCAQETLDGGHFFVFQVNNNTNFTFIVTDVYIPLVPNVKIVLSYQGDLTAGLSNRRRPNILGEDFIEFPPCSSGVFRSPDMSKHNLNRESYRCKYAIVFNGKIYHNNSKLILNPNRVLFGS